MKRILFFAALLLTACAKPVSYNPTAYRLYDGPAPGSEDWDWEEYKYTDEAGENYFTNIKDPEIVAYLPSEDKATGAAMIVCPGGSFSVNYYTKEGSNVAEWLADHGVAAFVLKYRLIHFARNKEEAFYSVVGGPAPEYTEEERAALNAHRPVAMQLGRDDGRAAIAYVRSHASEFDVDPQRIGIIGFSAGGMLTADVAQNHTEESRPNLVAPIYGGSLSGEVPADAAPLFIAAPEIDLFRGLTSIDMMAAWKEKGIPAEAHYFACDSHGFGYYPNSDNPSLVWIDLLYSFMKKVGFLGD